MTDCQLTNIDYVQDNLSGGVCLCYHAVVVEDQDNHQSCFLHSGTLGTVLCGVRGWHSEGLRRDFGNDSGSTTLGLASAPLTLFSVQCAVCIIQCSGVTPWFASVRCCT